MIVRMSRVDGCWPSPQRKPTTAVMVVPSGRAAPTLHQGPAWSLLVFQ